MARILAKSADDLRPTDVPDSVLGALAGSRVEDIHVLGRRGPAQAKFTTKELRELGELANADIVVDGEELQLDEASEELISGEPVLRRNLEVLRDWSARPLGGRARRLHLRFLLRPVAVLGADRVTGLLLERTRLDGSGNAVGTGVELTLEAQMVLRSVGYRGLPLKDLPFDEATGVIPNAAGRVLREGEAAPGEYVAGWIKRGPTGVIGTNKHDAVETVTSLLQDAPSLPPAPIRGTEALVDLLAARGVTPVLWDGWRAIDSAEIALGSAQGRQRVKIADREALLEAARPSAPSAPSAPSQA